MNEIGIIGLDLAKQVFQIHGASPDGSVVLGKKLGRGRMLEFFAKLPSCIVAMEACASAHYWGREIGKLGHEVRLINPSYVKPFVKRQKNDAADAEAIAEAASRPTMRFVPIKSAEKQASSMTFKVRDLLVRQRTQTINALLGHLMEYGLVAAQGMQNVPRLQQLIETHPDLPETARSLSFGLLQHIESLTDQRPGARLAGQSSTGRGCLALDHHSRDWCNLRHSNGSLGTLGGGLSKGRDFAAWIGLTPKQNSSGGKERRERHRKWAARFAAAAHHWRHDRRPLGEATRRAGWYRLARMILTKPPKLIAVALANKLARIAWALMARGASTKIRPLALPDAAARSRETSGMW